MKINEYLEQAYQEIEKALSKKDLKELQLCPYNELISYHFGLGMWIRNTLLQEEAPLFQAFIDCNVLQKDDMSDFLLKSFYLYLQENHLSDL